MNKKTRPFRPISAARLFVSLVALLAGSVAFAQAVLPPTQPTPADPPSADRAKIPAKTAVETPAARDAKAARAEDAIELSPFEVREEAGSGYATTSSVTMSRIATKNTEVPISAIVINEKLIEDMLAVNVEDTFNLVSGLHHGNAGNGNQENNDFSLRGYTDSGAQRDGVADSLFTSAGGFDYTFVERIEVVKGPNGILYGSQVPGGVINIVSKRPKARPFTKISAMGGSFGFWRGEIDSSQFFDKAHRFGFRVSGAVSNINGPVDFPGDPKLGFRGINPSVNFRARNGLEVWLYTAFIRDSSSRAKFVTPAFATSAPVNASTPGPTGAALIDRALILGGAGNNLIHAYSQVNTDTYELGASKSLKFGPVSLDARLIGRYRNQYNDSSRVRATGSNRYLDRNGNVIPGSDNRFIDISLVPPGSISAIFRENDLHYDERPNYKGDHNYGLDLNFTFKTWAIRHQTLINATYGVGHIDDTSSTYDITNPTLLSTFGYEVVGGRARLYMYPISKVIFGIDRDEVIAKANTLSRRRTITHSDNWGIGVMERMSFWNNRLFLIGGGRMSHVSSETGNMNFTTGVVPTFTPQEKTSRKPSVATLFKFIQSDLGEAMAYANFNQSYTPVFTIDRRLASNGEKFPDRAAKAKEFGVKVDLLRSRVVMTASVFDNRETNFLQSFIDTDGSVTGTISQSYQAPVGTRTTKGLDIDLNAKLPFGVETVLSYGNVKPRLDTGKIPTSIPFDTAGVLVAYRWRNGWLKGASATYQFTHWGKSRLDGGNRTYWEMPGGNRSTVILGYRWSHSDIRLRVENIFDKFEPQPSSFDQSVGITSPRNYRLGYTLNF